MWPRPAPWHCRWPAPQGRHSADHATRCRTGGQHRAGVHKERRNNETPAGSLTHAWQQCVRVTAGARATTFERRTHALVPPSAAHLVQPRRAKNLVFQVITRALCGGRGERTGYGATADSVLPSAELRPRGTAPGFHTGRQDGKQRRETHLFEGAPEALALDEVEGARLAI